MEKERRASSGERMENIETGGKHKELPLTAPPSPVKTITSTKQPRKQFNTRD